LKSLLMFTVIAGLISDAHQPVQVLYRCAAGELERPGSYRQVS
jgi:hypothetical protein